MSKNKDRVKYDIPQRPASERKGRKKLGKGLGALMGEVQREEPLVQAAASGTASVSEMVSAGDTIAAIEGEVVPSSANPAPSQLQSLDITAISPLPGNPRKRFDEDALEELAASGRDDRNARRRGQNESRLTASSRQASQDATLPCPFLPSK